MDFFALILVLRIVASEISCSNANGTTKTFNVLDYGAVGNGNTDDSQAFLKAWEDACSTPTCTSKLVVPKDKTFMVNPVLFTGPCKAKKIDFVISGIIQAPSSPTAWNGRDASQWLGFSGVAGLHVHGMGTIDGRGKGWWDRSCKYHPEMKGCTGLAPTALKFLSCSGSNLSNVHFINSPQTHILIMDCNGCHVNNLTIQSPENSPNTDGIHIQSSHHLTINGTKIGSGDDCISIGDYTSDVNIANVECGPGHGISIGSLGKDGNFVQVEDILVTHVFLKGTTNGARIKTWQVGNGYLRKVTFQNLKLDSVENPIIIDQSYWDASPKKSARGVQVSNVTYKGIFGTSTSGVAVNLNCSRAVPCSGISMESIRLTATNAKVRVTAVCSNAYGKETRVVPGSCLQN
ncbi:galacturonan 1,4-alpha-galacturonidase [Sarracenia purpurea var. burkii]